VRWNWLYRTGLEIRRHSSQRGNPRLAAIKFILEKLTFAYQDHFCISVVRYSIPPPCNCELIWAIQSAASFRMILTPIDTLKTTLQVQGARGTTLLRQRIKTNGVGSLWWGAIATAAATFVGHYPWFATVSLGSSSYMFTTGPATYSPGDSTISYQKTSSPKYQNTRSLYGFSVSLSSDSSHLLFRTLSPTLWELWRHIVRPTIRKSRIVRACSAFLR